MSIKEQAQSKYINRCLRDNIKRCQNMEFLPKDWVEDYPIDQLLEEIDFSFISPDSMKKITAEYEEYHHYIRPIVVTSNGWPIDGLKTLYHAKIQGINHVQAIVLDNVIKVW